MMPHNIASALSPRDRAVAEIKAALAAGQHVLIKGRTGVGKSWLVGQLIAGVPHGFHLSGIGSKKTVLLGMAERLFADGQLGDDYAYFADFADVSKRLSRLSVPELTQLVVTATTEAGYVLALDRGETLTERSLKDIVLPLAGSCTLLIAVDTDFLTPSRQRTLQPLVDKCKVFELPPLTDDEVTALLWRILDKSQYRHWQVIETKVVNTAAGRPGAVLDLAQHLAASGGNLAALRDLEHSAHQQERISLLIPALMLVITMVMASRYLARGLDDPAFYLLASLGYVFVLLLRPLLFRRRRPVV